MKYKIKFFDSLRVKDLSYGYVVVLYKYWRQYKLNSFVDRVCGSLREARYVAESIERADGYECLIINCNNRKYTLENRIDY